MPLSKIKDEFKKTYVAFGKGQKKLGERDDIDELAITAIKSKNPNLLKLFVQPLPPLEELQKSAVAKKLPPVKAEADKKIEPPKHSKS
jgi:hypothetical protein